MVQAQVIDWFEYQMYQTKEKILACPLIELETLENALRIRERRVSIVRTEHVVEETLDIIEAEPFHHGGAANRQKSL